jgi:hypothetical protein
VTGPNTPNPGQRLLGPDPAPPALPINAPVEGNLWNWVHRQNFNEEQMGGFLVEFVEYFNHRYAWTPEHTIPPCWERHGALIEEITTLMWTRWTAFQSPHGTADAAQSWHTYYLPGFLDRVNRWLGSAAAECRSGHHEPSPINPPSPHDNTDAPRQVAAAPTKRSPSPQ